MNELTDYLKVCEEAVRAGGAVVQDWVGRFEIRKKGPADLVTQADIGSQEAIRRTVLGAFPGHSLLSEEDAPRKAAQERTEFRWIADPLDGTTNYAHGVPHYSVSLALERDGELLVGAVFDPVQNECFAAQRGQGAWLNGRQIHVSNVSDLSEALATVGFPYGVKSDSPDLLVFLAMLPHCQAVRRTGSAALNLCYLAAGRFDVFWSFSTKVWDIAAGVLVLQESGGVITSPTGGGLVLESGHFLAAANRSLHAQLRNVAGKAVTSG